MSDVSSQVDDMIAEGMAVLSNITSMFRISHVMAAFSGGDDSIVSTHWAMANIPGCVVMTADTGVGLHATRTHQGNVCEKYGWDRLLASPDVEGPPKGWITPWEAGNTSYEEFVLNHGFPGPAQHHRMYQRLKQRAFRKIKRLLGCRPRGTRVLVVSGIRHDESAIRAGYKASWAEEAKEGFVWMNPFYWRTAADFEAYRTEFGLSRNPVKRRCGISGECCCGAFAAPGELQAYRSVEPSFADYLDSLQARVANRFPWGWGENPPKWWIDANCGQRFLFEPDPRIQFTPACVGCRRKAVAS